MLPSNEKGFSLLEVIIAITLMSIMMVGVITMVDQGQTSKETVTTEDREFMQAQLALSRIDTDFSQIFSPLYYSAATQAKDENAPRDAEEDENGNIFEHTPTDQFPMASVKGQPIPTIVSPNKNSIIFLSSANRRILQDSKQSRWAWIQYTLRTQEKKPEGKQGEAGNELIRLFKPIDPFSPQIDWDDEKEQVMLRNVKSMLFEYWDSKREKFSDSLNSLPDADKLTLRAIKVKLEWIDLNGELHKNERILRPLWPFFDTVKDELAKLPTKKGGSDSDDKE